MRFLFITNWCPHYRVRTFEALTRRADVRFVFFSAGNEWYWGQQHGRQVGAFPHDYLRGFNVTPWIRIAPKLIPIVWRFDGDVVLKCITGRFALPATLLICKLRRKPFVLWTGIWQHPTTLFHRLTFPLTRLVYGLSDAIVVYGEHVKRYLVSLGVAAEKIFVAAHAVDNPAYNRAVSDDEQQQLRNRFRLGTKRVLLYVGRLETSKGLETLVEAYARTELPGTVLVLVGEGSQRGKIARQAERLGVEDQILLTGYVAPEEIVAFYSIADALVLPSISVSAGKEPWGLVVNEAMNQGTPVIATTAVGAAAGGLVRHGINGEIVPEGDPCALQEAITRIVGDPDYRNKLSGGAERVISGWDNEQMVEGFLDAVAYAKGRRPKWRTKGKGDSADPSEIGSAT